VRGADVRRLESRDPAGARPFHAGADRFAPTAGSLTLHPLLSSPSGLLLALHPVLACAATGFLAQELAIFVVATAGALSVGAIASI